MVIVADGSERAEQALARVLVNDPGTGVMRHADAGYEKAIEVAQQRGLDLPMIDSGSSGLLTLNLTLCISLAATIVWKFLKGSIRPIADLR